MLPAECVTGSAATGMLVLGVWGVKLSERNSSWQVIDPIGLTLLPTESRTVRVRKAWRVGLLVDNKGFSILPYHIRTYVGE